MCLIWFSYRNIPGYRLLLAANRDEFFARPTAPLSWRGDILAGWDEQGGGTWLGINRLGQLAALTNHRDPSRQRPNPPSRGGIIMDYMHSGQSAAAFIKELQQHAQLYNPFNLLLLDSKEMLFYSNADNRVRRVETGVHALSNRFLDTKWPKTRRIKELLAPLTLAITPGQTDPEPFLTALRDRHQPQESELPATGVGLEWERLLAPVFIDSPTYGTRSSTLVVIGNDGRIDFYERSYQRDDDAVNTTREKHVRVNPSHTTRSRA
ncbi:MAG TPA: hypothetical protein DEB25_05925 [Desulfobulbaceae bacterium]|nr:hypothetical protein [Desulfobulbaceae bacterium]